MVQGYDLTQLVGRMSAPWLVIAGEADELSPVRWVYELARMCPSPSNLLIYQGARHALTESTAPALGPGWRATIADWLLDRVNGVPISDDFRFVSVTGAVEQRPHPRNVTTTSAGELR